MTLNLDSLPRLSEKRIALHVTPAAERALRKEHPWVFESSIRKQSHEGKPGDLAVIFDHDRRFLAIGLYDPDSPMRVKVLQHRQQATIDRAWFTEKLRAALAIREPLLAEGTNGYRLVHGENDGLPGLIVDRYAETFVLKLYTAAWLPHLLDIVAGLEVVQPFDRLVLRCSRNMTLPPGLHDGQVLMGKEIDGPIVFEENGLRFVADVLHGHKTGFFFDQRENRAYVRKLSKDRRVLDVFAYSGGFSVYAAAGGAESVTSLDISAPALEAAAANVALNQDNPQVAAARHEVMVADVFEGLEKLRTVGQTFNLIIVDPPSFAKSAAEVEGALATYARLTRLALGVLEPMGVLIMASCSSRVSADDFYETVTQAASDAGRPLIEFRRSGHALDHPIGFPEGTYLKALFASTMA